jgi:hypothetical protein
VDRPPLRERPFDAPLLIDHFITRRAAASGAPPLEVSAEALAILTAYAWPGNVRELESVIERAVAMTEGALMLLNDLAERLRSGNHAASALNQARGTRMTLRQLEQTYVVETLRRSEAKKSRAAKPLGLNRKPSCRKLDECREAGLFGECERPGPWKLQTRGSPKLEPLTFSTTSSGGSPRVSMMQSANFGDFDSPPHKWGSGAFYARFDHYGYPFSLQSYGHRRGSFLWASLAR